MNTLNTLELGHDIYLTRRCQRGRDSNRRWWGFGAGLARRLLYRFFVRASFLFVVPNLKQTLLTNVDLDYRKLDTHLAHARTYFEIFKKGTKLITRHQRGR